jgi:hypothetical protein
MGDILIDDKPLDFLRPNGKHTAAQWKVSISTNHLEKRWTFST